MSEYTHRDKMSEHIPRGRVVGGTVIGRGPVVRGRVVGDELSEGNLTQCRCLEASGKS